jgi:sporulation related protein
LSNRRFWLLAGLLFVVVAGATFLAVTLILDSDDDSTSSTTTSTTVGITTTTSTGELTTPSYIAIVVSEGDEATARATADELTESGFDSGVLHSDDYESLNPGFWVAYVGPFDDLAGANGAVTELKGAGYTASYARCLGTDQECS